MGLPTSRLWLLRSFTTDTAPGSILMHTPRYDSKSPSARRWAITTFTKTFKWRDAERHRRPISPMQAINLSHRVVFLVLFLVVCSALDALFTILHLQQGASEINPLMAMALSQGIDSFVSVKMSLTGLGVLLLAMYRNFQFSLKSLQGLAVIYGVLLAYHLWIFMQTASS